MKQEVRQVDQLQGVCVRDEHQVECVCWAQRLDPEQVGDVSSIEQLARGSVGKERHINERLRKRSPDFLEQKEVGDRAIDVSKR